MFGVHTEKLAFAVHTEILVFGVHTEKVAFGVHTENLVFAVHTENFVFGVHIENLVFSPNAELSLRVVRCENAFGVKMTGLCCGLVTVLRCRCSQHGGQALPHARGCISGGWDWSQSDLAEVGSSALPVASARIYTPPGGQFCDMAKPGVSLGNPRIATRVVIGKKQRVKSARINPLPGW